MSLPLRKGAPLRMTPSLLKNIATTLVTPKAADKILLDCQSSPLFCHQLPFRLHDHQTEQPLPMTVR